MLRNSKSRLVCNLMSGISDVSSVIHYYEIKTNTETFQKIFWQNISYINILHTHIYDTNFPINKNSFKRDVCQVYLVKKNMSHR